MLNNGQTVWTEQFTNEGGPKAEFLFENGLNVNSTPQDWLMGFLPLYNGTSQCPDDRIPSTTPGAEPPRGAKDSGSARSHSTYLETSSQKRP